MTPTMLPAPGPRLTGPPSRWPRVFSRSVLRRRRFYLLLSILGLALYYFRIVAGLPQPVSGYETYYEEELNSPKDADARYLHFKTRLYSRADEALASLHLQAHMAYLSDRAYVFDPLEPVPLGKYQAWWTHRRVVPLTAMLNTTTSSDTEKIRLKPVSSLSWHEICPGRSRATIRVTPQDLSDVNYNPMKLMDAWAKKLKALDARCVQVVGELFTDRVLEFPKIEPLFDTIASSPILRAYTLSKRLDALASSILPATSHISTAPIINNTVVLQAHIPPSLTSYLPYDNPCGALAPLNAPFRLFAHLRSLPTVFDVPAAPGYYTQRCSPTVSELVGRLGALRNAFPAPAPSSGSRLKHVYVIDGPMGLTPTEWTYRKSWFDHLTYELTQKHGWETVRWAKAGAKPESVLVDLEIATRAEGFIGNGFTEFSSNVALLRIARGRPKGSIRFV